MYVSHIIGFRDRAEVLEGARITGNLIARELCAAIWIFRRSLRSSPFVFAFTEFGRLALRVNSEAHSKGQEVGRLKRLSRGYAELTFSL